MYQPAYHREDRLDVQQSLIESHPFGLLISKGPEGIEANGLPFVLDRQQGHCGVLKAQIARGNTQWQTLDGQQVLVVFQGPLSYVTPAFYETKKLTGKVVPTWNYVMVQARGLARIHEDIGCLADLTAPQDADEVQPSVMSNAPDTYIPSQLGGTVRVEIPIAEISGKWKVNQDEHVIDRRSAAEGFAPGNPEMAALIRSYGQL